MDIVALLVSLMAFGDFVVPALAVPETDPGASIPPAPDDPGGGHNLWRFDLSLGGGEDTRVARFDDNQPTPTGNPDTRGPYGDLRASFDYRRSQPMDSVGSQFLEFGVNLDTNQRVQGDRDLDDFDVHDFGARGYVDFSSKAGCGYFTGTQDVEVDYRISGNDPFATDVATTTSLSYGWGGFEAHPPKCRPRIDDAWDPAYYRVTLFQSLSWRNDQFDQVSSTEPDRDGRGYLLGLKFSGAFCPPGDAVYQEIKGTNGCVHRHELLGCRLGASYEQRSTDSAVFDLQDGSTTAAGLHVPLRLLGAYLAPLRLALDLEGTFQWSDYDRANRNERLGQGYFGLSWRVPGGTFDQFLRAGALLSFQDSRAQNFDFDRNVYAFEYTVRFGTRRRGEALIDTAGSDVSPGPGGTFYPAR